MGKDVKKTKVPVKLMARLIRCIKTDKECVYNFSESLLTYEEALKILKENK